MTRPRSALRRALSRSRRAVPLVVAAAWLPAAALTTDDLSNGVPIGPVVVAPSLTCSYDYDTNVFLFDVLPPQDPSNPPAHPPPEPQGIATIEPAVTLTLPFGQSLFKLSDTLRYRNYEKSAELNGRQSNIASADLALNFSSLDSLELTADLTNGKADTLAFDPGGQVVFRGESYRLDREGMKVAREVFGQLGYRVNVARSNLHFADVQAPGFFDYSGYDGEAAALIPVLENANLSFGYVGTRFDHFDASPGPTNGTLSRREIGDTAYVGLEGRLGPRRPYHIRLGWESLKFDGGPAGGTDYRGVVGEGALALVGGSGFSLLATAVRTPYRSFFEPNNYYLYQGGVLEARHLAPGGTSVGGRAQVALVNYPDPVATTEHPEGIRERDWTFSLVGYANLAIRDHVSFRISLGRAVRTSNFPDRNYRDTVLSGGFIFGWL